MHKLAVGEPYSASRSEWPDGAIEYNCIGSEHHLRMFFADPNVAEVTAVAQGPCRFDLYIEGPIIFFMYRFGDVLDGVTPYTIHMVPEEDRVLPSVDLDDQDRALLSVVLVDAKTGIVQALRVVSLSPRFTRALHKAIVKQHSQPFSQAEFDRTLARIFSTRTNKEMIAMSLAYTKGGE